MFKGRKRLCNTTKIVISNRHSPPASIFPRVLHKLPEFAVKEGTVTVAEGAFANRSDLVKVTLPSTLQHIGSGAFEGCINLTSVVWGEENNLRSIQARAFKNCMSLSDFEFLQSAANLEAVGAQAFLNCSLLESVTLSEDVEYIGEFAFGGCARLGSVTFAAPNDWKIGERSVDKLDDPQKNATLLTITYVSKIWQR